MNRNFYLLLKFVGTKKTSFSEYIKIKSEEEKFYFLNDLSNPKYSIIG